MGQNLFKFRNGKLPLPVFFPDATRAVVKTLDSADIESTKTPGILVNTFHLWQSLSTETLKKFGGIRKFMGWGGAVISDSGGFQVMSLIKKGKIKGKIKDEGIILYPGKNRRIVFSPELSIRFQMSLGGDMVVVLDDFTDPKVNYRAAEESVERTISWAERSKTEFEKLCKEKKLTGGKRPYILGVVQGGEFPDLREYCTKELVKIGFDGLGWGGWPFDEKGKINFESAEVIARNSPSEYLLYGLGIGKPEDIVKCVKLGYTVFDCVLPTRDGRHGRLYVFDAEKLEDINLNEKFYHLYNAEKERHAADDSKISELCDCLLCQKYSKAYLSHLFKIGDMSAGRLSSIHNLRFYSILLEKLRQSP